MTKISRNSQEKTCVRVSILIRFLYFKKLHSCEEGGSQLRISVWHLLINLKNNYLLKTVEVGQRTMQEF